MINKHALSQAIRWSRTICPDSQLTKMLYDLRIGSKGTYQYVSTNDVRKACSNSFDYAIGIVWKTTNINFKVINNYFRMELLSDNVVVFQEVIGQTNIDIIFCATIQDFSDQLTWIISNYDFCDMEYAIIDNESLCSTYRYHRKKKSLDIQEYQEGEENNG